MAFTVSQVARLSLVSVRTLHHYDEIGLLRPSGRSEAGYRLYDQRDLERLQQILFFRELEFPLEEIGRIVDDPGFDIPAALRMQRQMLSEKSVRLQALVEAIDAAIERHEKGAAAMDQERDIFAHWREFKQEEYQEEVEQRWGDTESYRESKRRTARYTKEDWAKLQAEAESIYRKVAALMDAGSAPTSTESMDAAEEHRQHISRWFYPCPPAMHRGLGELYVNDPRFTANIDRVRGGLSQFLCAAFRANSER
jgi:MerR family transcriptional regulator, thiopeptide resistance regulator